MTKPSFSMCDAGTMSKPCIICVAITGSLPTKAHNPAVPITVAEQVESTNRLSSRATIVHAYSATRTKPLLTPKCGPQGALKTRPH